VIEGLESTNESFISHKQQHRLQILSVVSVIVLPLTLIASIFGMNVLFPGEGGREAFWIISGTLIATLVAMIALFRWKRWI
jgi:magnesium transporter